MVEWRRRWALMKKRHEREMKPFVDDLRKIERNQMAYDVQETLWSHAHDEYYAEMDWVGAGTGDRRLR